MVLKHLVQEKQECTVFDPNNSVMICLHSSVLHGASKSEVEGCTDGSGLSSTPDVEGCKEDGSFEPENTQI